MALWDDTIDTTLKVTGIKEKSIKPVNSQSSSAGYNMTYSRGTTKKRSFTISYAYLSKTLKTAIEDFFDANQGGDFTINDPDPNNTEVLHVTFDQDELEFVYVHVYPGEYTLSLQLREV